MTSPCSLIWTEAKKLLRASLQDAAGLSFPAFVYRQGERRDRLLFGKLILRDSSILNPLRDTLFLWLVWLLERKLTKKINNNNNNNTGELFQREKDQEHQEETSSPEIIWPDRLNNPAAPCLWRSDRYVQCLSWPYWSVPEVCGFQ